MTRRFGNFWILSCLLAGFFSLHMQQVVICSPIKLSSLASRSRHLMRLVFPEEALSGIGNGRSQKTSKDTALCPQPSHCFTIFTSPAKVSNIGESFAAAYRRQTSSASSSSLQIYSSRLFPILSGNGMSYLRLPSSTWLLVTGRFTFLTSSCMPCRIDVRNSCASCWPPF